MFALLKAYMKKTTFKVLMWIYRAKSCTGLNELKKNLKSKKCYHT